MLSVYFRESALLDRFHCFIEGWYLPRINKSMIYKGWTINVEYFSEILHALRTENSYGLLFDDLVVYDKKADMRDFKAVKKIATAAMKLLFPHWRSIEDVNFDDFDTYCLQPAIARRALLRSNAITLTPNLTPKCLTSESRPIILMRSIQIIKFLMTKYIYHVVG